MSFLRKNTILELAYRILKSQESAQCLQKATSNYLPNLYFHIGDYSRNLWISMHKWTAAIWVSFPQVHFQHPSRLWERVTTYKFLGFVIHDRVCWQPAVQQTLNKCAFLLLILRQLCGVWCGWCQYSMFTLFRGPIVSRLIYALPLPHAGRTIW